MRPIAEKRLTWRQERFVEAYVFNKGNGTRAAIEAGYPAHCAHVEANRQLNKAKIQLAIEAKKAELQAVTGFTKEEGLLMLLSMARASLDDFSQVWKNPSQKKNYKGLGLKRLAISSAKETARTITREDGSEQTTVEREIKIISPGERRAIINDLWEKLGLDKNTSTKDRISFLERFARLGASLGREGADGGQGSGGES